MTAGLPESARHSLWTSIARWFDGWATTETRRDAAERVDWLRITPFLLLHAAALGVIFTGASFVAVGVAVGLYFVRLFAITGFYHRYFSHRAYKTNRFWQFVFAVLGNAAAQRGPLWWAAHHRFHHKHADEPVDRHSPRQRGFWWSHTGWFTARANFRTDLDSVRDLAKFPELVFLDRFAGLVPVLLFAALYGVGAWAARFAPCLRTNGLQMMT
jgi:stearoyl-CoA desaturase (delta-9 desaturase)